MLSGAPCPWSVATGLLSSQERPLAARGLTHDVQLRVALVLFLGVDF